MNLKQTLTLIRFFDRLPNRMARYKIFIINRVTNFIKYFSCKFKHRTFRPTYLNCRPALIFFAVKRHYFLKIATFADSPAFLLARYMPALLNGIAIFPCASIAITPPEPPAFTSTSFITWSAACSSDIS